MGGGLMTMPCKNVWMFVFCRGQTRGNKGKEMCDEDKQGQDRESKCLISPRHRSPAVANSQPDTCFSTRHAHKHTYKIEVPNYRLMLTLGARNHIG